MKSIWDYTYIVTDVETTGSDPKKDRITEIACFLVHGGEIISEFTSLINPHKQIPPFIVNMTGISQEMVKDAPESSVIMKEINKFISSDDIVFVAHNVRFDYLFLQETMHRNGINFDLPQLCTLKLAKRMLPKDIKKNVGALASYYNINILHRHRAFGDAEATALILIELLIKAFNEYNIKTIDELLEFQNKQASSPKPNLEKYSKLLSYLEKIPESPGVFYLLNDKEEVLYIGMARYLKDKILSYFSAEQIYSKKISNMLDNVCEIRWTECISDLEAIILESNEISKYDPPYNVRINRYRSYPFIKINLNKTPIIEKCYSIQDEGEYFGPFVSRFAVDELIDILFKIFPNLKSESNNLFQSNDISSLLNILKNNCDFLIEFINNEISSLDPIEDSKKIRIKQELIKELKVLELNNFNNALLKNNVIIIKPLSFREKLLEIIFIHNGILQKHLSIGSKQNTSFLYNEIEKIYYSNEKTYFNNDSLDELRIINSYMYKHKNIGVFVYIDDRSSESIFNELQKAITNYDFDNLMYLK